MKRQLIKKNTEAAIQQAVIQYLKHHPQKPLYCASAGGMRTSPMQAARMKATGYVAGFPDIFIYEARGQYHGLAIELKREDGYASPEQKKWISSLQNRWYYADVCYGFDEARKFIDDYLSIAPVH